MTKKTAVDKNKSNCLGAEAFLKQTFKELSDSQKHIEGKGSIRTGFKALDDTLAGFHRGDLIILASRPSVGKSSLALNIAVNAAKNKNSVAYFTLESSSVQLSIRMLSCEAAIPCNHVFDETLTSDEWLLLTAVSGSLAELNFFIDDTPYLSINEISDKARLLKKDHTVDLIVIDPLQFIRSSDQYENRNREVTAIIYSLKCLAHELNVPILLLSQLSREIENRGDKHPLLIDLPDSSSIEQVADVILFLYRAAIYNPETELPNIAELMIAKNRNGATGGLLLNFVRELMKFQDL